MRASARPRPHRRDPPVARLFPPFFPNMWQNLRGPVQALVWREVLRRCARTLVQARVNAAGTNAPWSS